MKRQVKYQRKKIALGLCCECGKQPLFSKGFCVKCYRKKLRSRGIKGIGKTIMFKQNNNAISNELKKRLGPYRLIDPSFRYVKMSPIFSEIAQQFCVTPATVRNFYLKAFRWTADGQESVK